jgi:transcriptional regulator with XRE-family HTH domain
MPSDRRRSELAAFLRARRGALVPEVPELAPHRRRRTPGLRREEVASIADVSVTWYTWLEQGRAIRAARDTLERIAAALRLSPSDTAYLLTLALDDREEGLPESEDDLSIRLTMDSIDSRPAFIVDKRLDVVAFNELADRIYAFELPGTRFANNHLWRFFCDAGRRKLYGDSWERVATSAVGIFRANSLSLVEDQRFQDLLSELRVSSSEFSRLWEAQYTMPLSQTLPLTLTHGEHGRFAVQSLRFALPERPGHTLYILASTDRRTAAVFDRLRKPWRRASSRSTTSTALASSIPREAVKLLERGGCLDGARIARGRPAPRASGGRQFVDASHPDNGLTTNPEAVTKP